MKRKILSLVFLAAMTFGIATPAKTCSTVSQPCPGGGGWTGIVCSVEDWLFWDWYYCQEPEVEENL